MAFPANLPHPRKVDIAPFHIRADQLHAELLADVHAFKTAFQSAYTTKSGKSAQSVVYAFLFSIPIRIANPQQPKIISR